MVVRRIETYYAECVFNITITKFTTLLMQSYFTIEISGGIREFTEFPFGKDRSCMRRYFPGTDFGTNPKGEHINSWNGCFLKGPEILLFIASFANFSITKTGLSKADLWFFALQLSLVPIAPSRKPNLKPEIKLLYNRGS